nr:MAG TPA: hypothetical protein [Caudoviricetes sp.]
MLSKPHPSSLLITYSRQNKKSHRSSYMSSYGYFMSFTFC